MNGFRSKFWRQDFDFELCLSTLLFRIRLRFVSFGWKNYPIFCFFKQNIDFGFSIPGNTSSFVYFNMYVQIYFVSLVFATHIEKFFFYIIVFKILEFFI